MGSPSDEPPSTSSWGRYGTDAGNGRAGRGGEAAEALSLFTRNFAPLAPALVALLEGSSQAVDPQLRECATKREARVAARSANDDAEEEEEGEDLFLAAMRAAGVVE